MRTMRWPPEISGGRLAMVEGADATVSVVVATLSDLQGNPFNEDDLSLGNLTFRNESVVTARISQVLERLGKMIRVQSVSQSNDGDGGRSITVNFTDLESRSDKSVNVNG